MSISPKPKEQRRAQREPVCFRCEVDQADGPSFSGLIVNISPFGCLMRAGRDVAVETRLRFLLPIVGRKTARVVWSLGGRVGMEFEPPIDTTPYLAMLEQMSRPGDEMGIF